jgi:hypothetical protein
LPANHTNARFQWHFAPTGSKETAHMNRFLGLLTGAALSLAAIPAVAEPATLLGVFGNWTALSSGSGSGMTCFVRSEPRAMRPANAKRGHVYLMVSDWPGRKIKGEPEIVYRYPAQETGAALGVGSEKFTFFARAAGNDSTGWLLSLNDNPKLIDAMRGGVSVVATGVPAPVGKGKKAKAAPRTIDTYSLQGFGEALDKAHAACQM